MLERRRIREQVIEILGATASLAGVRVDDSPVTSYEIEELPALAIYTPAETWTSRGSSAPLFKCATTVSIEGYIAAVDGWAADLDDLMEKAAEALFSDPEFVKGFSKIASASMSVGYFDEGAKPFATAKHQYVLEYEWEFEPVVSDDLTTVKIELDAIDVADPNTGNDGYAGGSPGPDGRIEGVVGITLEAAP